MLNVPNSSHSGQIDLAQMVEILISPIYHRVRSLELEVMELRAKIARPVMPDKLLRPREAAAMLGVAETTIYRYVKEGIIPNHGVGHTVRVAAKDLLDVNKYNASKAQK